MICNPVNPIREPLKTESGEYVEDVKSIPVIRYILERVRKEAQKIGYNLSAVMAINRNNGLMRPWDISMSDKGRHSAATYAMELVSDKWRIATMDECNKKLEADKKERVELARKKLRLHDAAVEQLEKDQHFQNLVDTALTQEEEIKEFTPQDIAVLKDRLAKAESTLKPIKKEK
jgi:hypothetical protein